MFIRDLSCIYIRLTLLGYKTILLNESRSDTHPESAGGILRHVAV